MESLGSLVRKRRTESRLSVPELATNAKVSASYIYALESGQRRGNHFDKTIQIAGVLKFDLYEMTKTVLVQ